MNTALRSLLISQLGIVIFLDECVAQHLPSPYIISSQNYCRSYEVKMPLTNPNTVELNSSPSQVMLATSFFDGLGRPLQTVVKQASPAMKDQVSMNFYDTIGREAYKYLPYTSTMNDGTFKTNAFQQQKTFDSAYFLTQGQTWFYGLTKFEASPLNRPLEIYAPGNSWAGSSTAASEANRHGVDMRYSINFINDSVLKWTVTDGAPGTFGTYTSTWYAAGELTKIITEDEHGGEVLEFKDKEGKIVLKKVLLTASRDMGTGSNGHNGWMNTYYIYDKRGNLRCVIQPQGEKLMWSGGNAVLSTSILNEQCYRYEYDSRGRMIMKKIPGAGKVEMVYDARDRMVMLRDSARMSPVSYWLVYKYDSINRLTQIGIWQNNSSRATHQASAWSSTSYPASIGTLLQCTPTAARPCHREGSARTPQDGPGGSLSAPPLPCRQRPGTR